MSTAPSQLGELAVPGRVRDGEATAQHGDRPGADP